MMKEILRLGFALLLATAVFARAETFDVVTYTAPSGWQKQQVDSAVQLSVTDTRTGGYALAVIGRATPASGSAKDNFKQQWAKLVKGSVAEASEPTLDETVRSNGWEIVSGTGSFTDRGARGAAILLSATGNGRTATVVVMTNTQQYQNEIVAFIKSLDVSKSVSASPEPAKSVTSTSTPVSTPTSAPASAPAGLPGLWVHNNLESNGRFSNGSPMLTAGYFRREYLIKPDGTYVFRLKNWSVLLKEILFASESGTWKASGNQVTFTPTEGRAGWWAKAPSGKTTEWGARVREGDWKLETVTYTFDLHYYSGSKETCLLLTHAQPTLRDGTDVASPSSYSPRALDKSLIDNPPAN